MTHITLQGNATKTCGALPAVGSVVPEALWITTDLQPVTLKAFAGQRKIVSIFPSIDTPVCAQSVRTFHTEAAALSNTVVVNVSADLPFALSRFCGADDLKNAHTLSCWRSTFAKDWGVEIIDGPLAGLCARAVVVLDEENRVLYTEQVPEIAQEPNYAAALAAARE
jgi:thioredoxin-dependent peroxiredoxin